MSRRWGKAEDQDLDHHVYELLPPGCCALLYFEHAHPAAVVAHPPYRLDDLDLPPGLQPLRVEGVQPT